MLNYIFFHQQPFQLFIEYLQAKGFAPESSTENDCFEVTIPEDMTDELSFEIEEEYDRLFDLNQNLMDSKKSNEKDYSMASIDVPLSDGTISQANIKPELISKVLSALNTQELSELISIIVDAVENPDARTFCQRVRDDDVFSSNEAN